MDNQGLAIIIGGFVLGNFALIIKCISIAFRYYKQYLDLLDDVEVLQKSDEKKQKDLDAAHSMIREMKMRP